MIRTAFLAGVLFAGGRLAAAASVEDLLRDAQAAEARLDSAAAAELYLAADRMRPDDAFILQKIARQYSDLVLDQPTPEAKRDYALKALEYSQRATALDPRNAVNHLSVAISHGKLAAYSDTATKVRHSRLVKVGAENALALDPGYAWAHHILGRWHHEVAELSGTARFFVKLFYGGLPPASKTEAVQHLRRATELEPAETNHWLELGHALAAVGETGAARSAWEKGLGLPSRGKHDEPAKSRARAALEASR